MPKVVQSILHALLEVVGDKGEEFCELFSGYCSDPVLFIEGVRVAVDLRGVLIEGRHLLIEVALIDKHADGFTDDDGRLPRF